jgi:hypothetical protein
MLLIQLEIERRNPLASEFVQVLRFPQLLGTLCLVGVRGADQWRELLSPRVYLYVDFSFLFDFIKLLKLFINICHSFSAMCVRLFS